ncbi:MAG: ABC transporter permease [Pigmentiphaga sp.]
MISRLRSVGLEWAVPIALVAAIWFWTASADSFFFPPLKQVLHTFWNFWLAGPGLLNDALPSLGRWLAAYILCVILGVGIGIPMGLNQSAREIADPVLSFIRSTPPPALLPIAMIILGIGNAMQISMIVLVSVFPILLSTADGMAEIHATVRSVARAYRIPFFAALRLIFLPAAGPRILAGMRTSCSMALMMIILSEMFGSTNGIGYQILASLRSFAIAEMWSGIILIGVLGYLINVAFGWMEGRLLRWTRR